MKKELTIKDLVNENKIKFIDEVLRSLGLQNGDNVKFAQSREGYLTAYINCEIDFNHSVGIWKAIKGEHLVHLGEFQYCSDFNTNYVEFTFKIRLEEINENNQPTE